MGRKIIFAVAFAAQALTANAQSPDVMWLNGGLEGNLVGITGESALGARKVIVNSRYAIRAWKAYDKRGLWNVSVSDSFGAPGLSPDSTFFAHSGSEGTAVKVFLRNTVDGSVIESFEAEVSSLSVHITVASATKLYLYHGSSVDEIVKEGGNWNRTWRWTMSGSAQDGNGNRLILHPNKRWLFVCRGSSDIAVLDCTNKSSAPSAILNPPNSIRDMSLKSDGSVLAVASSSTLYTYSVPAWSVSTATISGARAVEWNADGSLALVAKVSGGVRLEKRATNGNLLSSAATILTSADYWTWSLATAVDGKAVHWDGDTYRLLQANMADQGVLAPAARVTRIAAPVDDKQVFVADDEGNVIGYDLGTGLRSRQFFLPGNLIHGLSAGAGKVAISTNSQTVIWNPSSGTFTQIAQGSNYGQDGYHVLHVSRSIVASVGAPVVAVASGTNVYLYNATTGGGIRTLAAGSEVRHVQFSGGGSHLMALTSNDQLLVWSTSDWNNPQTINDVNWACGAIDQSGTRIAIGKYTGEISKYQRSGNTWVHQQTLPQLSEGYYPKQIRFFKDGLRLAVANIASATANTNLAILNVTPLSLQVSYPLSGRGTALAVADSQQALFVSGMDSSYEDGLFRAVWNPFRLAAPWTMDLAPATVKGGNSSVGRVFLSAPAPTGGVTVTLASTFPGVAQPPAQITIPAGQKIGSFNISTTAQTVTKKVTITSTANGRSASVVINVTP